MSANALIAICAGIWLLLVPIHFFVACALADRQARVEERKLAAEDDWVIFVSLLLFTAALLAGVGLVVGGIGQTGGWIRG